MKSTKLSTKGQIAIPQALREQYGWTPGTELVLRPLAAGVMIQLANPFPRAAAGSSAGILKYDGPAKELQDMDIDLATPADRKARRASR